MQYPEKAVFDGVWVFLGAAALQYLAPSPLDFLLFPASAAYLYVKTGQRHPIVDTCHSYAAEGVRYINSKNWTIPYLQNHLASPTDQDCYNFIIAASTGDLETVKKCVEEKRVDPSYSGGLALANAAERGHTHVVLYLMSRKEVDPSVNNNDALYKAQKYGHEHVATILRGDNRVLRVEKLLTSDTIVIEPNPIADSDEEF